MCQVRAWLFHKQLRLGGGRDSFLEIPRPIINQNYNMIEHMCSATPKLQNSRIVIEPTSDLGRCGYTNLPASLLLWISMLTS
jgi:hypothetical protein